MPLNVPLMKVICSLRPLRARMGEYPWSPRAPEGTGDLSSECSFLVPVAFLVTRDCSVHKAQESSLSGSSPFSVST